MFFSDIFFCFFSSEFSFQIFSELFSGRFGTSGSMIPHFVPKISPLDAFCDVGVVVGVVGVVVGIGDSRSWIVGSVGLSGGLVCNHRRIGKKCVNVFLWPATECLKYERVDPSIGKN